MPPSDLQHSTRIQHHRCATEHMSTTRVPTATREKQLVLESPKTQSSNSKPLAVRAGLRQKQRNMHQPGQHTATGAKDPQQRVADGMTATMRQSMRAPTLALETGSSWLRRLQQRAPCRSRTSVDATTAIDSKPESGTTTFHCFGAT